ncbi:hypothetical protein [uncultured Winogradskyella sp.]|uniref:hypothetical protein n=1 Tax=uncultured Winogradskyella sp. TaxID=395353 RepID=UPI0030D9D0EF|tara:strand:+ start:6636 stop:7049 length:414 start_codon:yes stop_codon:yes gene_type:complete
MRFEDSPLSKSLLYKKMILDYGSCYLCDNFFIMEVNEGKHFNSNTLNHLLSSLRTHYGQHKTLAYISNRVNTYSIDPVIWAYFDKDDSLLIAASIVSYRDSTFLNANIEKQMASIPLKRALSLSEAVNWVLQLDELN